MISVLVMIPEAMLSAAEMLLVGSPKTSWFRVMGQTMWWHVTLPGTAELGLHSGARLWAGVCWWPPGGRVPSHGTWPGQAWRSVSRPSPVSLPLAGGTTGAKMIGEQSETEVPEVTCWVGIQQLRPLKARFFGRLRHSAVPRPVWIGRLLVMC